MTTFHVGQRVRLVGRWDGSGATPSGEEATIVEAGAWGRQSLKLFDWALISDSGRKIVADSHELRPLTPPRQSDSYTKVAWSDCLWQPRTEPAQS